MFEDLIYVNWSAADFVEIVYFLRSLDKCRKGRLTPIIPGIITQIVASVREGDGHWTTLARDHLGIQEGVLWGYLAQGDGLLLANLIHFTRHANCSRGWGSKLNFSDGRGTQTEKGEQFLFSKVESV